MAQKPVNLALQGGGAHGAFTWGVLDALLEDGRVRVPALSGTSAGAMNAVAFADGMAEGGTDSAREKLHRFWRAVAAAGRMSPVQRTPWDQAIGNWSLAWSPGYAAFDTITRMFSPYQLNPLGLNPLAPILERLIDFERVRECSTTALYISATNVETGKVKVFGQRELTAQMVLASACLPSLFQAVEIDGVPYWDGGYMGNPALFPLYDGRGCNDIVVVQINPVERPGTPKTAHDILDRINEISFNASLLKDLRALEFVARLIDQGTLSAGNYQTQRVHIIENTGALAPLGAASKLNVEWAFLKRLRDAGRETAQAWLAANFEHLGQRSTVDLWHMFGGTRPDPDADTPSTQEDDPC
ncbi:MAG: patatin-like phospholipase family protein [Pseudomonadota bacterium]